jgi:uncharacterized protein
VTDIRHSCQLTEGRGLGGVIGWKSGTASGLLFRPRHESAREPILLAVEDMDRSKRFYTGLGWEVQNDYKISVLFVPHSGSLVGFYCRNGLADMVGVSAEGGGFSGVVFNYVVRSEDRVEEVLDEAKKAGGRSSCPRRSFSGAGKGGSFLTLGSDPARFPAEPPACYRASWQLPGPDFHRQATTSLRTARSAATSQRHLPLCLAHE